MIDLFFVHFRKKTKKLKKMDENQTRNAILKSFMKYSKNQSIKKSDMLIDVWYTCNGDICNFKETCDSIKKHGMDSDKIFDMSRAFKGISCEFAKEIETNQKEYKPHLYDGFHLTLDNESFVSLSRKGNDGTGEIGNIELLGLKEKLENLGVESNNSEFMKVLTKKNTIDCIII
jgi:hypothetical protein